MNNQLRYDYSFMLSDVLAEQGVQEAELSSVKEQLLSFRKKTFVDSSARPGFMRLPYDRDLLADLQRRYDTYRSRFKNLLVLGIGGSDLGARAVISALADSSQGMHVYFLGGNTDPYEIQSVLGKIDLAETLVNVISKSGDTIETMSTFIYVRDLLITQVGFENHAQHIIATTDKAKGTLKTIADREGYASLVVPDDVGGRFSVLSTVGLFPIICAGINAEQLLDGAKNICESLISHSPADLHKTELFAALHYLGYVKRGQKIHVLLPYSARLREIGFWFRQLWAESLGKKDSLRGEEVFVGPTPIAALGATDQHSQFQLYYFGPFDKIFTFIDVEDHQAAIEVPGAYPDIEGISYMKGLSFNKIIRTELQASSLALAERKRMNGRLIIPQVDAFSVGELIQFFEIATAFIADLFQINAYDQPGVELGKQNMYALFDREGFHTRKIELEHLMNKYAKDVV